MFLTRYKKINSSVYCFGPRKDPQLVETRGNLHWTGASRLKAICIHIYLESGPIEGKRVSFTSRMIWLGESEHAVVEGKSEFIVISDRTLTINLVGSVIKDFGALHKKSTWISFNTSTSSESQPIGFLHLENFSERQRSSVMEFIGLP